MDKIPFVDGTKISNAKVTINEQEYEVTPAQYSGTTPVSAFNLNKMQNNIENTLVKVSATEPEPKADVWIQHGDDVEDDILVNDNGVYNSVVIQNITTGVEFKTKKVIDGHQIYAKYIDLGQLPSSAQSKWINIGIDFKNILNYYVKMTDQNSTLFMPVFSPSSDSYIYCYFNGTNIVIVVAKDRSAFSATLYIEYFKD